MIAHGRPASAAGARGRPPGIPATVRWPPPPPARPRHAWLLRTRVRRWLLRRVLRLALPGAASATTIVDLGAGLGTDARELERLLAAPAPERRWLLLDAQREMLRRGESEEGGRWAAPHLRAIADVTRLPIRDGAADLVLSVGLLCCVDDAHLDAAARESARILAPGGHLLLAVPRWRGRSDEARTVRTGLVRVGGGRPGHALFRKLQELPPD